MTRDKDILQYALESFWFLPSYILAELVVMHTQFKEADGVVN